jgi:hypothetical protein
MLTTLTTPQRGKHLIVAIRSFATLKMTKEFRMIKGGVMTALVFRG